ncbi:MAG: hypothetical protein MMC33_000308 [Icmadophila ericetorum]|nr:hypothetical protein [Icmadophila ericetorum]
MISLLSTAAIAVLYIHAATPVAALNATTYEGCFTSSGGASDQGPYIYQSTGWCQGVCVKLNMAVMALHDGNHCYCGGEIPNSADKVDDSECSSLCTGYNQATCGGSNAWAAYLTGTEPSAPIAEEGAAPGPSGAGSQIITSAPSATPTNGSPTIIKVESTVFVAPNQTSETVIYETEYAKPNGPNKAAIAAGIVVGVVVLGALVGGLLFWMQQRKRRDLKEQNRHSTSLSNFATYNEKPPSTLSLSDSRLDPSVMFARRQSDGSIADNQDYSRRILKVTNPDDK